MPTAEPRGPIASAEPPIGAIVAWLPDRPLTDDYRWCDGGATWSLDDFPELAAAGVTWMPDMRPERLAIRVKRTMPESFTCPECGATSHHPEDVRHGYCGACHAFTGDLSAPGPTLPGERHADPEETP